MMEERESSLRLGVLTFSSPLEVVSQQASPETRVLGSSEILPFKVRSVCEVSGSVSVVPTCDLVTLSIVKAHNGLAQKAG